MPRATGRSYGYQFNSRIIVVRLFYPYITNSLS
jgi:hypothetical protein